MAEDESEDSESEDEKRRVGKDATVTIETEGEDEGTIITEADEIEMTTDEDVDGVPVPVKELDFGGSFTVEVDGESAELFESLAAGEGFEDGMSVELARDLDELLEDDMPDAVPPPKDIFTPDVSPEVVDELSVESEQAEKLLKIAYQKLDKHRQEFGELPDQLVLGLPQFKTMEAYIRENEDEGVESRLPVDEIIVVPGPQIHPVRDPYLMVEDSLEDGE